MSAPILTLAGLRWIERNNASAVPSLMERAGRAGASVAREMLAGATGSILVVAGPGNNGGDAFVVARCLREDGLAPEVLFADDPEHLPVDAALAHAQWQACGGTCRSDFPAGLPALIIDGLFGIGLQRPIVGLHAAWIERINASGSRVLAIDIPSGLAADTGQLTGPCIRADRTATFISLKPGLLTADGPDHCGRITVCPLALDVDVNEVSGGTLIATHLFAGALQARRRNSHKGTYGNAGIIGGAAGMAGAALLAGRAALKLGSGRVYVGMLTSCTLDAEQPELMLRPAEEVFALASALAIGPGLGTVPQAGELLLRALASDLPLVIDADGLNLLVRDTSLAEKLAVRPAPTLLTPHPAEAARLLGSTPADVQADRCRAAAELARRYKAGIALKGCGTVVATPDGQWFINATGNPGLASAGSGDVLSGMIVALLAQGWAPLAALQAAVHLHGAAADVLVASGQGPIGLTAGELIDRARAILNGWVAAASSEQGFNVES